MTPEMRHKTPAFPAESALAMGGNSINSMDGDEISFEDLLCDEPALSTPATSFDQLLADGFPPNGGLEALAAIAGMEDPGPRLARVKLAYLEILKRQKRST